MPAQQEFIPNETGSAPTDCLQAISQGFSSQASSPPGETKPTQTMTPPLLNGLAGVTSRVDIPYIRCYKSSC